MNTPLVSIIVPLYNVEAYLEECINSLINQSYKHLEIILVNDGSPDNCDAICRRYAKEDKRVVYIKQDNMGLSGARNTGLMASHGEYILYVDSDDWCALNMVEVLLTLALDNNALFTAGGYKRIHDGKKPKTVRKHPIIKEFTGSSYVELMARPAGVFCFAWNRLMHRSIAINATFPVGKTFEDVFTMPKIAYDCDKIMMTSETTYFYRIRNTSISHKKFSWKAMDEMDAYLDLLEFGKRKNNRKVKRYASIFYLTKYYYYFWRVIKHNLGLKEYKNKYKPYVKDCWKSLF